jgi:HEPN domain-containing protein
MKSKADLVGGWLKKAESDLAGARLAVGAAEALDGACFHAQQAAEKSLKAYLTDRGVTFPFVHNLEKLIELCVQCDREFLTLKLLAQELTPFAVELRYDSEFWPSVETARVALQGAVTIHDFVLARIAPAPPAKSPDAPPA